jgi:hypothetical protein
MDPLDQFRQMLLQGLALPGQAVTALGKKALPAAEFLTPTAYQPQPAPVIPPGKTQGKIGGGEQTEVQKLIQTALENIGPGKAAGAATTALILGPLGIMAKAKETGVNLTEKGLLEFRNKLIGMSPKDQQEIFKQSKTFADPMEKKLMMEIPDTGAALKAQGNEWQQVAKNRGDPTGMSQKFLLQHPDLDLHKTYGIQPVTMHENIGPGFFGWANPDTNSTVVQGVPWMVKRDPQGLLNKGFPGAEGTPLSIALHEFQHLISRKEGLAPGFSPEFSPFVPQFWENQAVKNIPKYAQGPTDAKTVKGVVDTIQNKGKFGRTTNVDQALIDTAHEVYAQTLGEAYARMVQKRWSNPWLYPTHPVRTLESDVPRSKLIPEIDYTQFIP